MITSTIAFSSNSVRECSLSLDEMSELSTQNSSDESKMSGDIRWFDQSPSSPTDSSLESAETNDALSNTGTQSFENFPLSNSMLNSVELTDDIISELLSMDECDDTHSQINSETSQYLFYQKFVTDGEIRFVPYTAPELNPTILPSFQELSSFESSSFHRNSTNVKFV